MVLVNKGVEEGGMREVAPGHGRCVCIPFVVAASPKDWYRCVASDSYFVPQVVVFCCAFLWVLAGREKKILSAHCGCFCLRLSDGTQGEARGYLQMCMVLANNLPSDDTTGKHTLRRLHDEVSQT